MRKFYSVLLTIFSTFIIACSVSGQAVNQLSTRCPSPNQQSYSRIIAAVSGNINYTPCPTFASVFFGNVDFTNATITGISPLTTKGDIWGYSTTNARIPVGANDTVLMADSTQALGVRWATGVVTGSGTINYVPRFTAASVVGNTPFSWDATTYTWQNTALNSTFPMSFVPTSGGGSLTVGNVASSYLNLAQGAGTFNVKTSGTSIFNTTGAFSLSNLAGTSDWLFTNIPTNGAGNFTVGNLGTSYLTLDHDSGVSLIRAEVDIQLNSLLGQTTIGDLDGGGNGTTVKVIDATPVVEINSLSTQIGNRANAIVAMGDTTGAGNVTKFQLDDSTGRIELISDTGYIQLGDTLGSGNSTVFKIDDTSPAFTMFGDAPFVGATGNDCVGMGTLGAAGTIDLSTTTCWTNATANGTPTAFAIGRNTTGILTSQAGVITSSTGAADNGTNIYYWIWSHN